MKGNRKIVDEIVSDMKSNNENSPEPIACMQFSGKFKVRVPPEIHRNLAIKAGIYLEEYNPQLVLSGHTHGRQVSFFGFAPIRPRGSGKYVCGWYGNGNKKLYFSSGLGTSVIPIRFMSSPEICVIDWKLT